MVSPSRSRLASFEMSSPVMTVVREARPRARLASLAIVACFAAALPALSACGSSVLRTTKAGADAGETSPQPGPDEGDASALDASSSPCSIVGGQYGACDKVLGWGFDGKVCRQWNGCDCAPDCAQIFPTAHECAQSCRREGGCNTDALVSQGIARFAIGGSCDSLEACVPAGLEGELGLALTGDCQSGGTCGDLQTCPLKLSSPIDQESWEAYCRASLIAGVRLECFARML
jgi:hypothetical protein